MGLVIVKRGLVTSKVNPPKGKSLTPGISLMRVAKKQPKFGFSLIPNQLYLSGLRVYLKHLALLWVIGS